MIKRGVYDLSPMMANRSAKRDITDALNAGADDYITKPESRNVIAARVNALLRGNAVGGAFDTEVTYGAYKMNRLEQSVSIHGQTVILTAKEFELAEMFSKTRTGPCRVITLCKQFGARRPRSRHAH